MFLGIDKQLSKTSDICNIKIDKDEIKRVNQTKYLGLTTEESLSWNQQYKNNKREHEVRAQFYQKTQTYTATITIVSTIASTCRKPSEVWKPDMGSSAPKRSSVHWKRYKTRHSTLFNQPLLRIRH